MEPFLLMSILSSLAALIFFYGLTQTKPTIKLPPGSFGWPLVGETLAFVNQNHDKFVGNRMKKHSMQRLFRSSYQTTSSHAIPKQTEAHIYKAPGFLRAETLAHYVELMDSLVAHHFDTYWPPNQVVEAHSLAQLLVLTLAGKFFWGLEDQTRIQKLLALMDTMMFALHVVPLNFPGTTFYRAMKAAEAMRKEIMVLIKEKKAAIADGVKMKDILSFMILNPDPTTGRLMPENEAADKVMGLASAAFNSPAMTTAFIVKYLGERPDVRDKVRSRKFIN